MENSTVSPLMGDITNDGKDECIFCLCNLPSISLCPVQACLHKAVPNEQQHLKCTCVFCFEVGSSPPLQPKSDIACGDSNLSKELWLHTEDPLCAIKNKRRRNAEAKPRKKIYVQGTEYFCPPPEETDQMRKKRRWITQDPASNKKDC